MSHHVLLFTMEGCGPCHALLAAGMPSRLQRAAAHNAFTFGHYEKVHSRVFVRRTGLFLTDEYLKHVKQSSSYPEACLVIVGLDGLPRQIVPFVGRDEIERLECWLNSRTSNEGWSSAFVCHK